MGNELSELEGRRGVDPRLRLLANLSELELALRAASVDEDGNKWDAEDCSPGMIVVDNGSTVVKKPSFLKVTDMVRAKNGYDKGTHIWEITWDSSERGSHAVIGIASYQAKLQDLGYSSLCGSNDESLGWDIARNVLIFNDVVIRKYPDGKDTSSFTAPNVITVILNMDEGVIGFKAGGENYGVALRGLKQFRKKVYPAISTTKDGARIKLKYIGTSLPSTASPADVRRPVASASPTPAATAKRAPAPSSSPKKKVEPLTFSKTKKSRSIDLSSDLMKAEREGFMAQADRGVVLSSRPLSAGERFEVKVNRALYSKWTSGLKIGVTEVTSGYVLPNTITNSEQDAWVWSKDEIIHGGKTLKKMDSSLDLLKISDKVGVMLQPDRSLHCFLNGEDLGQVAKNIPAGVYGVVDVHGTAIDVSLVTSSCGSQPRESSASSSPDPVATTTTRTKSEVELIIDGLKKVVKMLKERNPSKIGEVSKAIKTYMLDVYEKYNTNTYHRLMGDEVADLDGAEALKQYWIFIMNAFSTRRDRDVIECYINIRNVCWNLSDSSFKLSRKFGECGLIDMLVSELGRLARDYQDDKVLKYFLVQNMAILYNGSRVAENKPIYDRLKVVDKLMPLADSSHHTYVNIQAIMTVCYIVPDLNQPTVPDRLVAELVNLLRVASANERHRAPLMYGDLGCNFGALELVKGLTCLAGNPTNITVLVRKGIVMHLVTLMKRGDDGEKECAANATWVLTTTGTRDVIVRTDGLVQALDTLSKDNNESVKQAAIRVSLKLKSLAKSVPTAAPKSPKKGPCEYNGVCRQYVKKHLKIPDEYFNEQFHSCYCTECHAGRNDNLYYTRGVPPKDFGLPIGWVRFGTHVNQGKMKAQKVFETWHRAYHGTKPGAIPKILETGELLLPGDVGLSGDKMAERDGHFTDDRKPDGFDTKCIFVSPSIRYAGHDAYATPHMFNAGDKQYKARAAFMVCCKPDSYQVGNETVGLGDKAIDPKFSNQEIEWSTKRRGAVIIYGLLVKLEEN